MRFHLRLGAALAALSLAAPAWSAVSIDEYSDSGSFSCGFPGFALMSGGMAFGTRLVSASCNRIVSGGSALVGGGTMQFGFSDLTSANGAVQFSQRADFQPLVPGVKPPIDLTEGGLNGGLEIRLRADSDLTMSLTLGNGVASGSVTLQLDPTADFQTLFVPFASLGGVAVASSLTSVDYRFSDTTPQPQTLPGLGEFGSSGSGEIDYIRAVAAVPEPGTWALMLAGVAGLVLSRRVSGAPRAPA